MRSTRLHTLLALAAALAAASALAACESPTASAPLGPPSPVPYVAVQSVRVLPAALTLPQGGVVPMTALARTADGRVLRGRAVSWTSSDPAVAHVDAEGVVTALQPGAVTITATVEGLRAEGRITVVPARAPAAFVEIAPGRVVLSPGQSLPLSATVRDAGGNVLDDREVAWAGGLASVATVDAQGVVTAHRAGTVEVLAWCEGQLGVATIVVVAPTPAGPQT